MLFLFCWVSLNGKQVENVLNATCNSCLHSQQPTSWIKWSIFNNSHPLKWIVTPQNHKAPLCFLRIASIAQYYCKICHYTTQMGRSVISSHCQPRFKAGHSRTTVCDTLSRTIFRLLGLKVLLNALGSCSALNNPSQSAEKLSISTLSFGMRNRILDSGRGPQNFVLNNSLFRSFVSADCWLLITCTPLHTARCSQILMETFIFPPSFAFSLAW